MTLNIVPLIKKINLKYVAIGVVILSAFVAGWKTHSWKTDSELLANLKRAERINKELGLQIRDTEKFYLRAVEELHAEEKEVIRYVNRYITKDDDSKCVVTNGFVELHNSAATGKVGSPGEFVSSPSTIKASEIAATVTQNYFTYLREAEKLRALQAVVTDYLRAQEQSSSILPSEKSSRASQIESRGRNN